MASDALLVDDGEPALWSELVSLLGARDVVRQPLTTGDLFWYTGEQSSGGERKRADDLVASILDDRLLDECQRMSEFDHRWLFVEGFIGERFGKTIMAWDQQQIIGDTRYGTSISYRRSADSALPFGVVQTTLLKLQAWAGVRIVWARDTAHVAAIVAHLWRTRDTPPVPHLWRPNVELMRRNPVAASYLTIEEIGEKTALALAEAFPNERALMEATDEQLRAITSIGPKRLAAIRARYGRPLGVPTVPRTRAVRRGQQRRVRD